MAARSERREPALPVGTLVRIKRLVVGETRIADRNGPIVSGPHGDEDRLDHNRLRKHGADTE